MWTCTGTTSGYYGGYTDTPVVIHRDYKFENPDMIWGTFDVPDLTSDKKEGPEVSIHKLETGAPNEFAAVCSDHKELSADNVLTTLSAVKGELMLSLVTREVKMLECSVTPAVKENLLTAGRRLRMYGKPPPIVPQFDEWWNRLPDEIHVGDSEGITLKIVDPEEYGTFYLALRATAEPIQTDSYYDSIPF